jgi:hypothetical protein
MTIFVLKKFFYAKNIVYQFSALGLLFLCFCQTV